MQNTEKEQEKPWNETIRTIIIAVVVAVVFRSFAFEPFNIPSGSMKSNLLVGDYLFVSKYSFGYSRYSFPFGFPIFSGRIMEGEKLKRGEVIVFRLPSNPRIDYIKRLMAVPGDRIQVKNGVVHINGIALKRRQVDEFSDDEKQNDIRVIPRFEETLLDGTIIQVLEERQFGQADNTPVYEVPPGQYFFMGDNRDNSRDSRFMDEVGFVPEENIIGRAEMIFFSTNGTASLFNPISWVTSLRADRFFKMIH